MTSTTNYVVQQFANRVSEASNTKLALAIRLSQNNPQEQLPLPRTKSLLAKRILELLPARVLQDATAHKQRLSAKDKLAAKVYKGPEYSRLNSLLRGGSETLFLEVPVDINSIFANTSRKSAGETKVLQEYRRKVDKIFLQVKTNVASIRTLYNVLQRPSLRQEVMLFRGENYPALGFNDSTESNTAAYRRTKGSLYEHNGFVSFSVSPYVALNFLGVAECCLYRLKAGRLTPGLMYSNDSEFEFVMPPSKFLVTQVWNIPVPGARGVTRRVLDLEFVRVLPLRLEGLDERRTRSSKTRTRSRK